MKPAQTTRIAATVLIAATALAPALSRPVAAQPTAADDERRARARAYASAGIAAHDRGDYDQAIALFEQAYAELPHPALFFNLAQAHRLAGHSEQALGLYRRYLAAVPDGELAAEARTWITNLEKERGRAEPAAAPPKGPAPAPGLPPPADPAKPSPVPRNDQRALRYGAYGAAAASAIAIGIGAFYGIKANDISDELSQPNVVYRESRFQEGESAQTAMFVWYGVGGALLTGAAVLYFVSNAGEETPATAWIPTVGPDGAGISWSARF